MYKSPVELISKQMNAKIEDYIFNAIQEVAVNVDKDELIRALKYDRDQYEQGYGDGKQANQWISVEDRLPDNDSTVLCWYEYRIMDGTYEDEMAKRYGIGYYFKGWGGEVNYGCDTRVIAWQPLPEPPKED